jgi:hypothetical protein
VPETVWSGSSENTPPTNQPPTTNHQPPRVFSILRPLTSQNSAEEGVYRCCARARAPVECAAGADRSRNGFAESEKERPVAWVSIDDSLATASVAISRPNAGK